MCPVQVGGVGSFGAEDGDGAGQDEVHQAALQVFLLPLHSVLHESMWPVRGRGLEV